jgi:hypothetical protein
MKDYIIGVVIAVVISAGLLAWHATRPASAPRPCPAPTRLIQ